MYAPLSARCHHQLVRRAATNADTISVDDRSGTRSAANGTPETGPRGRLKPADPLEIEYAGESFMALVQVTMGRPPCVGPYNKHPEPFKRPITR